MKLENVGVENVELNKTNIHITLCGLQDAMKLAESLNRLVGEDVVIKCDKARKKRSLNANSYERVLEGKIASALDSSKDEIHNLMLARYGQYERDANGNIVFLLMPASLDTSKDPEMHLKPTGHCEQKNGADYYWYAKMKPSHEYNTQEMAKLIDGVISEAKELDIEVLSDDELRRIEANG